MGVVDLYFPEKGATTNPVKYFELLYDDLKDRCKKNRFSKIRFCKQSLPPNALSSTVHTNNVECLSGQHFASQNLEVSVRICTGGN